VSEYHSFNFAESMPLTKTIVDYLKYVVEEKYYLSDKMVKYFTERTIENEAKGNGFRFKPHRTGKEIAFALTNPGKNRLDDNYVDIGSIKRYNMITYYEEKSIRRLTPEECFRLMGMKDEDIALVNSDTQSYKIAGNGIEINTMRSIICQLYRPAKPKGVLF